MPGDLTVNEDESKTTPRLRRGLRHVLAMVLLAIPAALWLIWGPLGPILYVGGLFNSMGVWVFVSSAMLLLMLPAMVLLPVLAVYTPLTWRRQTSHAKRSLILWMVATGGLVVPTVVGFTGLTASPFDLYVRGFTSYVKTHADIEGIQNWLDTLNRNEYTGPYGSRAEKCFAVAEQPACIASLNPKRATVWPDDTKDLTVKLLWGGGLIGHWGIVVGRKDMPIPPSDTSRFGEQRFRLAPGAYLWSGE
jgi:hypothetical protein